jgi:hypothetical protein
MENPWILLHGRSRRFESCSAHSLRGCPKRAAPHGVTWRPSVRIWAPLPWGTWKGAFFLPAPLYRSRTKDLGVISPFLKRSNWASRTKRRLSGFSESFVSLWTDGNEGRIQFDSQHFPVKKI